MIKKLKMKNLNLLFAGVLILLMYKTPTFLDDVTTSVFGRAALVIVLAYTLIYCEFSCSVLFALIIIVLFHNTLEGFKEGAGEEGAEGGKKKEKKKKSNSAEEEEGDEEGDEEGEEEGDAEGDDEGQEEGDEEGKEGFLGINMISNKVLNKNFIGGLRNNLKHNLTDFDRFLKTDSERNTISSTKQ